MMSSPSFQHCFRNIKTRMSSNQHISTSGLCDHSSRLNLPRCHPCSVSGGCRRRCVLGAPGQTVSTRRPHTLPASLAHGTGLMARRLSAVHGRAAGLRVTRQRLAAASGGWAASLSPDRAAGTERPPAVRPEAICPARSRCGLAGRRQGQPQL